MPKPVLLCVDDERTILNSLRQELEQYFGEEFHIEVAENGDEALELFEELTGGGQTVQIVISDQLMPGMKGDELLVELYQRDPRLKGILLTGQANADAVGNAINRANLFRYIAKPWDEKDLRLTVAEAARTYRDQQELNEQIEVLDKLNRCTQYLADTVQADVLAERLLTSALLDTRTNAGVLWLKQAEGQHRFYINDDDRDPTTVDPVREIRPADAADRFPVAWMNEVYTTGQPLVLESAFTKGPLTEDRRVKQRQIQSICAVPIAEAGMPPFGVLYLEEQQLPGHFSGKTLEYLQLLAGYAAVSFKNTWLYHNLEASVQARTVTLRQRHRAMRQNISFARRIQNSILPPMEELEQRFPQSYVLYMPKDVVSGDFYWMGPHRGWFLAAAVDCTGHGVPGAFVSVLGSNLLTQAVYDEDLVDPADILNWVNRHVRHTLRQYDENSKVQDGMDLALVAISEDMKRLRFAGAKRPLWLLRAGELEETKGDRFPIGGSNYEVAADQEIFETKEIPIHPRDRIFLFSDGLTDQFGGEDGGRKFSTRAFRELLLGAQDLPMRYQRDAIRKGLSAWQGEQPQTDDRVLLGLEIPAKP